MSPVSDIASTPFVALSPEPAIALTKSAIDSFLLPFESPASTIAILSAATSTAAAVSSFKSNAIVADPEAAPPLKPLPATTSVISAPPSAVTWAAVASGTPPAVDPS